jgi:hypothetical protein
MRNKFYDLHIPQKIQKIKKGYVANVTRIDDIINAFKLMLENHLENEGL